MYRVCPLANGCTMVLVPEVSSVKSKKKKTGKTIKEVRYF